jgi:tetratricopeptide (TPR) repeat protein
MTLSRPNLIKLLGPVGVFCAVLAALFMLNGSGHGLAVGGGLVAPGVSGGGLDDSIPELQSALRDDPSNVAAYAALGEAYLQRARATGDPSLYSRAGRAFDAALRRDATDPGALIGAGTLAGLRHDFADQLQRGLEARRAAPDLARPYTVIADAQIELGRYGAAAHSIQRLVNLKPGLAGYARASYFRELTGDLPGAVDAMRLAASAGGTPESVAYVQALLGDLELQRGELGAARTAYLAALRSMPDYPRGLIGLARLDAAGGDYGSAAARLRRATDRLPLTSALTLLAEVELAEGRREGARADLAAARAQQRLLRSSGARPDAEAVLFEANYGSRTEAVRLGRRVWADAPSVRSADALGWALTRAGRPGEGYAFARRALILGSRDPLFRLHAGIAAMRSWHPDAAAHDLAVAEAGHAALSPRSIELLEEARR